MFFRDRAETVAKAPSGICDRGIETSADHPAIPSTQGKKDPSLFLCFPEFPSFNGNKRHFIPPGLSAEFKAIENSGKDPHNKEKLLAKITYKAALFS